MTSLIGEEGVAVGPLAVTMAGAAGAASRQIGAGGAACIACAPAICVPWDCGLGETLAGAINPGGGGETFP